MHVTKVINDCRNHCKILVNLPYKGSATKKKKIKKIRNKTSINKRTHTTQILESIETQAFKQECKEPTVNLRF